MGSLSSMRYEKRRVDVGGIEMATVDVGEGDPIVFLHGNPTSSFLWRNVIPHVEHLGRCIAPDLIGFGDSDKLPDAGPGSYRFVENRVYLDRLLASLDVSSNVTLVLHDWGSGLGFDWARRHPDAIAGIAYLEANGFLGRGNSSHRTDVNSSNVFALTKARKWRSSTTSSSNRDYPGE